MLDRPSPPATLLWIRRDFRFHDNSALAAAIENGAPLVPVFIWDPELFGLFTPGAASRWWLQAALRDFTSAWQERGGNLVIRQGESIQVLRSLIRETGANRVYWNRCYEPVLDDADQRVRQALLGDRIGVGAFNSSLLVEPSVPKTGSGNPYQVFTPFWKSTGKVSPNSPVTPNLAELRFPRKFPPGESLEELHHLSPHPWHDKLKRYWIPGEKEGRQRLTQFVRGPIESYAEDRDRPDRDGTSRLSPYLHWGHIGPRQILAAVHSSHDPLGFGPATFIKEIYWREFAFHVLHHFPDTPRKPLRKEFESFPWQTSPGDLRRWQKGETGYPVVDAGMRQLWETGWMHNRVRMITASFLVKHLLLNWQEGANWFWDTLVDADLANNTLGWQWTAGCGADAAPYFRIFNPLLQAKKFDPKGNYVRRWVPEIAGLPDNHVHSPWTAPPPILTKAGVELDANYPRPLIDVQNGRQRALEAFARFKAYGAG